MCKGLEALSAECLLLRVGNLVSEKKDQVNLKSSVPSSGWISLYISGMFLIFFSLWRGEGGGEREESNF